MTTPRIAAPSDKLYIAGGAQRLIEPRLDGSPLLGEIDYDELAVVRHWREYEPSSPDETRYLMYELSQRDVGQLEPVRYFKAVRLIRVTRVPRYLRQGGKDPNALFDQQRDVLAALAHVVLSPPSVPREGCLLRQPLSTAVGEPPETRTARGPGRGTPTVVKHPGRTIPTMRLKRKQEKAADQARRSCGLLAAQPLILDQTKGARDTVERLIADHLNGTKEFNELIVDYPNVANWHLI